MPRCRRPCRRSRRSDPPPGQRSWSYCPRSARDVFPACADDARFRRYWRRLRGSGSEPIVETWVGLTRHGASRRTIPAPPGLKPFAGWSRSSARAARERKHMSVDAVEPSVDLTLGVILRDTIALLKPAGEFRPFALDHVEVVVGELAPLLLSLAFELIPVAFNTVPIHCLLLPYRNVRDSLNPGFERKFRSALGL